MTPSVSALDLGTPKQECARGTGSRDAQHVGVKCRADLRRIAHLVELLLDPDRGNPGVCLTATDAPARAAASTPGVNALSLARVMAKSGSSLVGPAMCP